MSRRLFKNLCTLFALLALMLSLPITSKQALAYLDTYDAMLKEHVRAEKHHNILFNGVDYYEWFRDPRHPRLMKRLTQTDPASFETEAEKKAFWINAYNILTIDLILKEKEKESIKNLGSLFKSPWKKYEWVINGQIYTLDQIEHDILRPMGDARIHFAINCASLSCPDLRREAYFAHGLDKQLDNQVFLTLANETKGLKTVPNRNMIYLTRVMQWFDEDFSDGDLVTWLETYKPDIINEDIAIRFFEYNWALNKIYEYPNSYE